MTIKNYQIDAQLMQGIVSVLSGLPWGQIDGLMQPLKQALQAQENSSGTLLARVDENGDGMAAG